MRDGLAGLGISVRAFPDDRLLSDALRITCPPAGQIERLIGALNTVMAPEALLFDLDGVLADVGNSYREAIIQTAATFDVVVTREDIQKYKASGNANNDWILTQKILADKGKVVGLDLVTKRFEAIYHGTASEPGLKENEELIADIKLLETLHRHLPLAIVTGRPRVDAEEFLDRFGIKRFFNEIISMEDAEMKPSSDPVIAALGQLGVQRAWMIGDTPDDMRSARGAGVLPLGIVPPGEESNTVATSLIAAGAGRVLNSLNQLKDLLP